MQKDKEFENALKISPEEVKRFFQDRPCISVNCFEKEAGLPRSTISNFLPENGRDIPSHHMPKIIDLMVKYGYDYYAD